MCEMEMCVKNNKKMDLLNLKKTKLELVNLKDGILQNNISNFNEEHLMFLIYYKSFEIIEYIFFAIKFDALGE